MCRAGLGANNGTAPLTPKTAHATMPSPSHVHAQPQVGASQQETCVDPPAPIPSPREPGGKFAAGNPGGPGRPKGRRVTEGRRAVEEAVTPDMLAAAMRKCALLALQGNLAALRILLERTLGRPAEVAAAEPLDIEPLRLRTAADCTAAIQKVTDAICAGPRRPPRPARRNRSDAHGRFAAASFN